MAKVAEDESYREMKQLTPTQLEHIQQFILALESGEYKQIKHKLRSSEGYCCLGVACEMYRRATGEGEWQHESGVGYDYFKFMGELAGLPSVVLSWYGITFQTWRITADKTQVQLKDKTLAHLNDKEGKTFSEIANILRQTYFPETFKVPTEM